MALPSNVPNHIGALRALTAKELGTDSELFMTRFAQLTVPVIFSAQQELALALKAYLLWGDLPTLTNHLLAVAFDDLRTLADDLILKSMSRNSSNPDIQ